ncbi:vasorin b [Latimeria chalumnae]|nr:PREDICTED: vasorin [Latimeria chalumnae]XP_006007178.1 PREDICTED: vasorin [Latimeria chalumnae]|eukprot:XP_006007177.1 PREDICTED: vasorin [Latimeria chalumnae]
MMNWLLWTFFLVLFQRDMTEGCPTGCHCQPETTVFCMNRKSHTVPKSLSHTIKNLYLFENGITALNEDDFSNLQELQLLDLSQNKIVSLQDNIFQPLTALCNLDLSSNQIRAITNETFYGLHLLERLYLHNNKIESIHPAAFDILENLLELKLQNNQLHAIPALDLPRLLLLDISGNKIPVIESEMFHAVNIESLNIAGLGLRNLDEELFQSLSNLHELDISDNQLTNVPAILQRLHGLTKLNLTGNAQISQLQVEDFQSLQNLQELDISNINLNTVPEEFFSLFPKLHTLTAAGNPFNCVCQLDWFVQWIRLSKVVLKRSEETRCHFPPINAGKLLENLEYKDFGCPTTTTTTTTTISTTTLEPLPVVTTRKQSATERVTSPPIHKSPPKKVSSTILPSTALKQLTSPGVHLCPSNICLNGGTCQLDTFGHLECLCPAGYFGSYCEIQEYTTKPPPLTIKIIQNNKIHVRKVTGTSVTVDLQSYMSTRPQLKGIRLTYRNLSSHDKRPYLLSLPPSLTDYTVRGLRLNSTYYICLGPLGERNFEDESCTEVQTSLSAPEHTAPVTQTKDNNLPLMIIPSLAVVLLVVVAVAVGMYYYRHKRSKDQSKPGIDQSNLELEGVKTCLENGDLTNHDHKSLENTASQGSLECEVPLMQQHCPSNNNTTVLKPSYF